VRRDAGRSRPVRNVRIEEQIIEVFEKNLMSVLRVLQLVKVRVPPVLLYTPS
jgi:hypothetical protein